MGISSVYRPNCARNTKIFVSIKFGTVPWNFSVAGSDSIFEYIRALWTACGLDLCASIRN